MGLCNLKMNSLMEKTLVILKPDAIRKNLTDIINCKFEKENLVIIAQKRIKISKKQAQDFYSIHKSKSFFDSLVSFMISGPIIAEVLQGENAVFNVRKIIGDTNSKNALKG